MTAVDFDEVQALVRMTQRREPFIAKIATATLAVIESRRDAEIRAATAEAALATEREKLGAIRQLILSSSTAGDQSEVLRQIALVVIT